MFNSKTPEALFVTQLHALRATLPGIRDGDPSSIHDSRVAIRRIRELLQFAGGPSSRPAAELRARFTKMGKALGRVRDADVRIQLISGLETRIPQSAPWLVTVRQTEEHARERLARRLIKRLEKLEITALVDRVAAPHSSLRPLMKGTSRTGGWRRDLSRMITARACATTEAIEHATGVYFPNRIHRARIALKRLRYALEIADEVGSPDLDGPLSTLKKTQDILGDLHDRQTLLEEFASKPATPAESAPNGLITLVNQVVEAEARRLHERYLSRRATVLAIARDVQTIAFDRPWAMGSLMTASAGVLALSTGLYVGQRRSRQPGIV